MIPFTRYNFVTGRVMSTGTCEHIDVLMQAQSEEEHIFVGEKIDGKTWYLPDGIKTLRPVLPIATEYTIAADGVDAAEFSVPAGTQIESLPDGELWPDEDEFHFTSEATGSFSYRVYLPFPYQDPFKVTINAN